MSARRKIVSYIPQLGCLNLETVEKIILNIEFKTHYITCEYECEGKFILEKYLII